MELNDELLCAYLDGELDEATRTKIAKALESDAGGRVRLERMRTADTRLRREIPLPRRASDPMAAFILRTEEHVAAPSRTPRGAWYALAAGIVGLTLGFLLSRFAPEQSAKAGSGYAAGAIATVLEIKPSGVQVEEAGDAARVLLTMRARDGRMCRLFVSAAKDVGGEGVACRDPRGWRVVAWDEIGSVGGFRTAGASPVLDAVMDRLDGATLDAAAERAAIDGGWKGGAK